jgi:hypothetical protein
MGIRTSDEIERTMQRLALVERRLERLEALVRQQNRPEGASHPEAVSISSIEPRRSDIPAGELRFPEIRLQLVETPAPVPATDPGPRVTNAPAAIEDYAHLLQPLCTLWGHPEFDRFVNRLLVDERGGRKGFSAEAVEELLFLAQLNHHFSPTWLPRDPWADSQFIGDRI